MQRITIQDHDAFLDFLNNEIDRNDYRFKYLIPILDKAFGLGEVAITENTSILRDRNHWAIYIETHGQLFIYGESSTQFINELSNIMNFNAFSGFDIMGEYHIVYQILKKSNVETYSVIKDRVFYTLDNTDDLLPSLRNTQASMEDINELTQMMLDYYAEEYQGQRNKNIDQITPVIINHISENSIQILKENNIIQAFCTIINPDIGIIYVRPEFRNRQIGKMLLSTCSRTLVEQNNLCFLMTDLSNDASNKMCLDIGFREIYRHTNIQL